MADTATTRITRTGKTASVQAADLQPQPRFLRDLYLEQKRTERSRRPFVLILFESDSLFRDPGHQEIIDAIRKSLVESTRETDSTGWYKEGSAIGTIFTEIEPGEIHAVTQTLLTRCTNALGAVLRSEAVRQIRISCHRFPEDWDNGDCDRPSAALGPQREDAADLWIKRSIDVVGSLAALTMTAPLLLVIAALVKMTSKGPVFFRQQRVGLYGKPFTFLKFRSMHEDNDSQEHEAFVRRMIQDAIRREETTSAGGSIYKIQNDPRVTRIGRLLRRTSLDEVPQFLNVLLGDMSLVGPRPPIPYEVQYYDIWHRRRLLECKPGITGLWQIAGRGRVRFDDMVRMDLRYSRSGSAWFDLKILLQTPGAVIKGSGAF